VEVSQAGPDVRVRTLAWLRLTQGAVVQVNGRDEGVKAAPGTYLTLARTWRNNDTIEVRMPVSFSLNPVVDQPNVASVFYGPVLLAAEESSLGVFARDPKVGSRAAIGAASGLSRLEHPPAPLACRLPGQARSRSLSSSPRVKECPV
jgi:DUF1680 family protein